jgi:hypothetical protein
LDDIWRNGYFLLHEGKTIHQFKDRWDTPPRYAVRSCDLASKPQALENARFYRAACREVARSTDERTVIAAMLPPGVLCGHTINVERKPAKRSNAAALSLVGVMNSFAFDWMMRQKAAAHVSLYILADIPIPQIESEADRFLAHGALRLSSNRRAFLPLWREQLGAAALPRSWPVLAGMEERWLLRASMDAIVAHAYGLNRADYQRILSGFSHNSYRPAPLLCLAAFDEIAGTHLKAFCRRHDPYFDIPLVVTLARPVIKPPTATAQQNGLLPIGAH